MPRIAVRVPPAAKRVPKVTVVHGERRVDDYHWLRNKASPSVRAYLRSENAYTAAMMKPSEGLQKKLYKEMLARIKETDTDVPYREGAYYYYSRTEKGKQYRIFCRKQGSPEASEAVILDVNRLAQGHKFYSVGAVEISPDGNLLAFSSDTSGFREYTLHLKDLRNGKAASRPHRESALGRMGERQPHAVLRAGKTAPSAPTACIATCWAARKTSSFTRKPMRVSRYRWRAHAAARICF